MIDRHSPEVQKRLKISLARKDFWGYCKLTSPDFYKEDRAFLKDLAERLQWFVEEADEKFLVVNMPPRHGKSRTATKFVQWLFGKYGIGEKVMTGSYNETLSSTFAKAVRDTIAEKPTLGVLTYNDIFPNTKIKYGEASAQKWALEGSNQANYLATSPTGTATGFGCFVGDTEVITDKGVMKIEDIFNDKSCNQVLSFDIKNGKIRYNKIIAKRRLISNDIVKVKTASGKEITCTADHRFYTKEKGWVRADSLRNGNTFVTASDNTDLRKMWQGIHKEKVRSQKGFKEWLQTHILFKGMFMCNNQRKSVAREMCSLWKANKCKVEVLFDRMQKQKHGKDIATRKLSCLWERVQTTLPQNNLLFNGLQKQSTFRKNERQRKFPLQNRYKLQQRIFRHKTFSIEQGRSPMSDMWCYRKTNDAQEIWYNNEFKGASQRRKYSEQYNGQSDNTVSRMPYKVTQDEVAGVERLAASYYVYDIQVENNENFFANGVLVHNCNIMIIDDLIKNDKEAYNENTLQGHIDWFNNTMLSRTENNFKVIIIMTRWATNDLAGFILENFDDVVHVNYKAVQEDGSMLCPEILSRADYDVKTKNMNKDIILANYQQEPMDIKGRLYSAIKTYTEVPKDDTGKPLFRYILNYTDTADEGSDFLCSICYGMYESIYYVIDVLYTKEPMEVTEPATAEMLTRNNVGSALIESNNGGKGFARNVQRELKEKGNNHTLVKWFHQGENKIARILSNSTGVMNNVLFPVNWQDRWPEFARDLLKYQKEGKNAHDDAPDCLTGVYENPKPKGTWMV